jgi:putative transposase
MKTYQSIYYHITFATKDRMPLIKKHLQNSIYNCIWEKCKKMGLYLHKIDGIEDHIHMLLYIPPKLSGASVIGQIKGASSYYVNNEIGKQETLYWQRGYGMKTVSESDVSMVKQYIMKQEEHHTKNTIIPFFEEINFTESGE